MAISKKVTERIITQLKKYRSILVEAKDRDINESDTVVIIADMLADILGYKKYLEITTEFAIRGTYVDLAVKVGNEVRFLIEAKAIDSPLKDIYIKQAIDYGANHGIEWVILSNGINWQIYKIHFKQPIDKSLVYELDVLQTNPKDPQLLECLGNLSREGFTQSSMSAFYQQKQVTSKFSLAAILLSQPLLLSLKRELKKISPTVKVDEDFLKTILQNEILKREVVDSDEAKQALDYIKRISKVSLKAKSKAVKINKDTNQE
ncbi:MAG: restriction endonuclease subunit R [Thermodesulfobacteriota bacterium]